LLQLLQLKKSKLFHLSSQRKRITPCYAFATYTELNTLADMRGNNIIGLEEMSKKTITTEEAIDLIMRLSINE
jgi:hypothetical protein